MSEDRALFQLCDRVRETRFARHGDLRACRIGHEMPINVGAPKRHVRKSVASDIG